MELVKEPDDDGECKSYAAPDGEYIQVHSCRLQ